jgi:hypothetical protein
VDWIVVEGVKPWDGRYEFDLERQPLTTREWGWIKRLAGYLPITIDEGFDGGDPELFTCFAVIALRRAGQIENRDVAATYERIIDLPQERTIRIESDTEAIEDDASPPATSSNGKQGSSGPSSPTSSETLPLSPARSGTPASASSGSGPATSAS